MCASTPEKVEILSPPAGCKPGDHVLVDGYVRNPDTQLNPKKKIFETCAPDLTVNSSKEACFKVKSWKIKEEIREQLSCFFWSHYHSLRTEKDQIGGNIS